MKNILFLMIISSSLQWCTVYAATIIRGAEYRVSGSQTFGVIPVSQGSTVRWWMHRTEINEIKQQIILFRNSQCN